MMTHGGGFGIEGKARAAREMRRTEEQRIARAREMQGTWEDRYEGDEGEDLEYEGRIATRDEGMAAGERGGSPQGRGSNTTIRMSDKKALKMGINALKEMDHAFQFGANLYRKGIIEPWTEREHNASEELHLAIEVLRRIRDALPNKSRRSSRSSG